MKILVALFIYSDMEELGEQVLGKLQSMTDEEFAEISLEAAE